MCKYYNYALANSVVEKKRKLENSNCDLANFALINFLHERRLN